MPSVKTLTRISQPWAFEPGNTDSNYLSQRIKSLNAFETQSFLMIDEVYVAKKIELMNGQVYGQAVDDISACSSTILCVMIKSLYSKYRDVVCLHPISRVNGKKIYSFFFSV